MLAAIAGPKRKLRKRLPKSGVLLVKYNSWFPFFFNKLLALTVLAPGTSFRRPRFLQRQWIIPLISRQLVGHSLGLQSSWNEFPKSMVQHLCARSYAIGNGAWLHVFPASAALRWCHPYIITSQQHVFAWLWLSIFCVKLDAHETSTGHQWISYCFILPSWGFALFRVCSI